jgi:uncharacterized membrane protein HdeD (DUF308 family)
MTSVLLSLDSARCSLGRRGWSPTNHWMLTHLWLVWQVRDTELAFSMRCRLGGLTWGGVSNSGNTWRSRVKFKDPSSVFCLCRAKSVFQVCLGVLWVMCLCIVSRVCIVSGVCIVCIVSGVCECLRASSVRCFSCGKWVVVWWLCDWLCYGFCMVESTLYVYLVCVSTYFVPAVCGMCAANVRCVCYMYIFSAYKCMFYVWYYICCIMNCILCVHALYIIVLCVRCVCTFCQLDRW